MKKRVQRRFKNSFYPSIGFQDEVHSSLVNSIHELDNGCELEFAPKGYADPEVEWGQLLRLKGLSPDNIILSSEHFVSRLREKGISFVRRFLSENFEDYSVKIVVFLRRQDDCFTSRMSTLAKAGAPQPYDFWLGEVLNGGTYYDYSKLLRPWADAFGRDAIHLVPYDKRKDVVKEFCCTIGLPYAERREQVRMNSSWDPLTTEIAFYVNSLCKGMKPVERRRRLNQVNRFIVENNINSGSLSEKLISSELAKKILGIYSESNSCISKDYFDGVDLFEKDVKEGEYFGEFGALSKDDAFRYVFRSLGG